MGQTEGDLTCSIGDVITDVICNTDGWWTGTLRGRSGVFPSTYTEVILVHTAPIKFAH